MTKKLSKEVFFTNFRDVIQDGLLKMGFELVTNELVERIIVGNDRYRSRQTPEFDCPERSTTQYVIPFADDIFGIITLDLYPKPDFKKGWYYCNLHQSIGHIPTQFLLAELQNKTFHPFEPLYTWGVVGNGGLNSYQNYNSNLPAEKLQELAEEVLLELENKTIPWLNQDANLAYLEKFFDQLRHPYFGKVCFYISINKKLKARAEMNRVTEDFAFKLKRSISRGFDGFSREEERSRRCQNIWIDNQIIEQVNHLTLDDDE